MANSEAPYLVPIGSGSCFRQFYQLSEGRLIIGSSSEADLRITDVGVEYAHCMIENKGAQVTLHPISGSTCVDGVSVTGPFRLTQGCSLTIGPVSCFRFNNPAESRQSIKMRKPPPVPKRSLPEDQINFLGKLSKFELLARQARLSPKVFPKGSVTTSVPADQILSRPPSFRGNDENRNSDMTRSFTCHQRPCDLSEFSRDFDMSQSLIVAKTTTCTEFLKIQNLNGQKSKSSEDIERQEKLRLDEILAMCAEYERQERQDSQKVPSPNNNCNGYVSVYENIVPYNNNNNNISSSNNNSNSNLSIKTTPPAKPKRATKVNHNKIDVSNQDLLEAIEQLSMLSKGNVQREREMANGKGYLQLLQSEKQDIAENLDGFKRSVVDIETQEEEMHRELELEKALLSAEYESESLKLTQDETSKMRLQLKINELEDEMAKCSSSQTQLQNEAKQRVQKAQQAYMLIEEELNNPSDERKRDELLLQLSLQSDILETEKKAFEDLEFHHLEEEASKLAAREELQRHLSDLSSRIEARKIQLNNLDSQRRDIKNMVSKEAKSLERQKLANLRRIEEGRNRLRAIDSELETLTKNNSQDLDRISKVTIDSPILNNDSLTRRTIESFKEIETSRQLNLAKQASQVISEERKRVQDLKRRIQDQVRSQWEERNLNCTSFNSVESGEESSSYSTGPAESGSGSTDGADNGTGEKLPPGKASEFTSPSPGPSGNSYTLLQAANLRDERPTSMENERYNGNGSAITDESESRPLSQTSSELGTISPIQVKHRDKQKSQRPLTRYLPIKSESLDLRYHIETAGHQLPLIHDVTVDATSCSGYLSKMSKKFHHWNKRWFVFDRKRKTLSYYSDSHSKKPRRVIYFQSIVEVYIDHMNNAKSPQPSLTFIVKTSARLYHLMAPSPEAMRVWVDVIFTGAEGYNEFDNGI